MKYLKITEDNLEEYAALLPPDMAECIGREYCRAVTLAEAGEDGPVLVYELKNADEEEEDTAAELLWMHFAGVKEAEALLEAYREAAAEEEVARTSYEFTEYDEDLKEALTAAGFTAYERESRDLVVSLEELAAHPVAKGREPSYIAGLEELMVRQYRRGIMDCLFHKRKGVYEDLASLPMSFFDEQVSSCVMADGRTNGFLLVHALPSGQLVVGYMCAFEPDMKLNLAMMIRRSIQAAASKYPADTRVILRRHNEATANLTAKLFPKKTGATALAGEREEE